MPKKKAAKKKKISQESIISMRKFFWLVGLEIEGSLEAACQCIGTSRASAYTPKKDDDVYAECLEVAIAGLKTPKSQATIDGLSPALTVLRNEYPALFDRWRMEMVKTFRSDGAKQLLDAEADLETVHVSASAQNVVKQLQAIRRERMMTEEEEVELSANQSELMGAAITTVQLNQVIMKRAIASFSSIFRNGRCADSVTVKEAYAIGEEGKEILTSKTVTRTHSSRDPDIGDIRRAIGTLGPLLESMTGMVSAGVLPEPVVLELYRSMRVFQDGAAAATAKYNKIQQLMETHGEDFVVGHLEEMIASTAEGTTTTVVTEIDGEILDAGG